MKVLFLVQKEQRVILDRLYEGVAASCECDIRWLDRDEQANLKKYFKNNVNIEDYDRILFFLRFKQEIRQASFIRTIPRLAILEHDAYQNYISCKYAGKFSSYYRKMPWARVISSGSTVAQKLQDEGFDAVFVAKGYDEKSLCNLGLERNIELAFVGSLKSGAYSERKVFLDKLALVEPLKIMRTNSGEEYLRALNSIRFFVSADVGMGEYMIKNFEAMACGCVLFAYDQGADENEALGFIDMYNVVLYRSVEEFREKLAQLRRNPDVADSIAEHGCQLVNERFRFSDLGKEIARQLHDPLRDHKVGSFWQRVKCSLLG